MVLVGIAVILSFLFFLSVLVVLVLVRRGDAPARRTSRAYDASRREAVRLLTGEVAPATSRSWSRRRGAVDDAQLEASFRSTLAEAMRTVVPEDQGLVVADDGTARLARGTRIVGAVSTAALRARGANGDDGLEIGLVLVDPEPPGTDPGWVALPVQVLFPALERSGRTDLIDRFASLATRLR